MNRELKLALSTFVRKEEKYSTSSFGLYKIIIEMHKMKEKILKNIKKPYYRARGVDLLQHISENVW
ncbi:hypothetical protein [Bacillus suaedaesalsae]|uniref:Transposase n=1 Tax=Bacillus suaedaesalsae TaxID=2810349 RepID=A0ABS2DKZ0_9BACI|nr:hypothetical protein [Bacillus suaedaesalsae]MBM6619164.1 hypothetical protein [Bacillus suaedaesalsae]